MESNAVKTKIIHPRTQQPMERVYVEGKGWYGWNSVYHVYNATGNYDQLQKDEILHINFDMKDVAVIEEVKVYRWANPFEWLSWAHNKGTVDDQALLQIAMTVDPETIIEHFQSQMDADGYFDPEEEEEEDEDEDWWDEEDEEDEFGFFMETEYDEEEDEDGEN